MSRQTGPYLVLLLVTVAVSLLGITGLRLLIDGKPPAPRLIANTVVMALVVASTGIGLISHARRQRRAP
jgi:hypothetical protein